MHAQLEASHLQLEAYRMTNKTYALATACYHSSYKTPMHFAADPEKEAREQGVCFEQEAVDKQAAADKQEPGF